MSATPSPRDPSPPNESAPERSGSHFGARIRNYFLTGLVVAGPIAITLWLTWSLVTGVDGVVRPIIPVPYRPETYLPWPIPGTGLIIAFVALTMLGFLTANLVGRKLVEMGERILDSTPLIRSVYKGLKQVFETLFSGSGTSFRRVGLIEFPSPGMWSLVFISQPPGNQIAEQLPEEEHLSVFMPCTPNPTTGFFFYVPRARVIELDIPVEAAAKLIMSAGLIQPNNGDNQKKLSAFAAAAQTAQTAQAARVMQAGAQTRAAAE